MLAHTLDTESMITRKRSWFNHDVEADGAINNRLYSVINYSIKNKQSSIGFLAKKTDKPFLRSNSK